MDEEEDPSPLVGAPSIDDTSHRPARTLRIKDHEEVEVDCDDVVSVAVA